MKKNLLPVILTISTLLDFSGLSAQKHYSDYNTIKKKIESLSKQYPALCSFESLAKTIGGKEVFVLTIGTGEKGNKPGIAVLGGIEGPYLAGREIVLGFAENILRESAKPEIKSLLNSLTFYIFPDMSPDASEQYFSALRFERAANARPTDDDRDFLTDEDPYEDLNNDSLITLIRISDPSGTYLECEEDKRIMVPADLSKGQKGSFFIYTEGIDNDKDGSFNEDFPGGVSFNRNFTYNYEEFGINAGLHAVSEIETKALADFFYDHFNIYMIFSFGPQDNLCQPFKRSGREQVTSSSDAGDRISSGQRMEQGDKRITEIMKTDEVINKLLSDKYHEITGMKGAPSSKTTPGNFIEWAYYHYGRYSFSTPGWWFPMGKGENAEVAFLNFADKNKQNDVFVPWTEISHSDFPGKKVEVGGIKPFLMINPPADSLEDIITRNYNFLTTIAAMHPELEFLDVKVEDAGENVFRVTLKVHNKGIFATCAEIGDANQWTRIMRITLEPADNQNILSGYKVQRIPRLEGDSSANFSWLISGKGAVKVTAGALNTGTINTTLDLK